MEQCRGCERPIERRYDQEREIAAHPIDAGQPDPCRCRSPADAVSQGKPPDGCFEKRTEPALTERITAGRHGRRKPAVQRPSEVRRQIAAQEVAVARQLAEEPEAAHAQSPSGQRKPWNGRRSNGLSTLSATSSKLARCCPAASVTE